MDKCKLIWRDQAEKNNLEPIRHDFCTEFVNNSTQAYRTKLCGGGRSINLRDEDQIGLVPLGLHEPKYKKSLYNGNAIRTNNAPTREEKMQTYHRVQGIYWRAYLSKRQRLPLKTEEHTSKRYHPR
ncbi:hypothetical protein CJ030_MR8G006121 [Morella rubra]|uniref:Uncharacterized protein n=1 Tax=Morella rubra TaxID=262757 RepID=A0A6A1UQ13_9ROSI|nr:hypothetical protein CJ030_MR8G006121 [Morella rubra]